MPQFIRLGSGSPLKEKSHYPYTLATRTQRAFPPRRRFCLRELQDGRAALQGSGISLHQGRAIRVGWYCANSKKILILPR
jgi:hypothetical protein